MSDLYAEQLEMQLRFAEEQSQEREMVAYEQGKVDGAREFAEWLCRKSDYTDIDINGFTTCRCGASPKDTTIEQALAEWQKEVNNE